MRGSPSSSAASSCPTSPAARDAGRSSSTSTTGPKRLWRDGQGAEFNPGNYYYVGGNSKFYGAVMLRYRERDFAPLEHADGVSPAWPFPYARAGALVRPRRAAVPGPRRGGPGPDRAAATRPPTRIAPVPDEPAIAAVRERLAAQGLQPFSLPLAIDIERWLQRAATPWDAFPDTRSGKLDAETAPLAKALRSPDVTLVTGAYVDAPAAGRRTAGASRASSIAQGGERRVLRAGTVVLAAGAVNSAALLLRSRTPARRASPTAPASSAAIS